MTEFQLQNTRNWKQLLDQLFPGGLPRRTSWTDPDAIRAVLRHIGSIANVNHAFFPDGGGLDLLSAASYGAEGLTEFDFGGVARIGQIINLSFESFGDVEDYQWNYFRLEMAPLEPIFGTCSTEFTEELTELQPGQYAPRTAWDERRWNDEYLPPKARLVARLLGGSIVIFQKSSYYNSTPGTYSAPHQGLSGDELRDEIEDFRLNVLQALAIVAQRNG